MAKPRTDDISEELKEILDKLTQVYLHCWTYEDKGIVKEIAHDESGRERVVTNGSFTTAFDREARRLRYEFKEGNPTTPRDCIVWRNGSSVKLWTRAKAKTQTLEKIGMAIASAIGYSGESAFLIPHLLAPREVKGRGVLDLDELCLAEKLDFNGTGFFKIAGYYPSRSRLSAWLDVKTLLILKAEVETATARIVEPRSYAATMGAGAVVTKTVITYWARMNTVLEDSKFEIKIPEK